ncbi:hypothetical protein CC78DRAFT_522587 [Lojkania enalia]|uniref:Zn(2)-C6 fungal-type domain-containing protein n=1 Tax=Lojkania enalia TaxID=147567 RepID=A0A9P4N0V0_9PLEO|nr:hypothetical protein CC78DRAFT_522587 [Didymosphaeria enalia]
MSSAKQRRALRTKTGCLTCKPRRKKCDEALPICGLCSLSRRSCQWPSSADVVDRRYASHPQSRHSASSPSSQKCPESPKNHGSEMEVVRSKWPHAVALKICFRSESAAHQGLSRDLELTISRHFIEKYYGLLLLPNCHPAFYDGWITEIQYLMLQHKSLHFSVLANGASHLHFIDASNQMQELALTYYSNALRNLSDLLAKSSRLENHNGLLMSVMLLYLHGCMGRGTYTDIPNHVNAATRILTLRLFDRPLSIRRPFDRLAVESVLYQIFLVSTGLWSEDIPLDYEFDSQFWLQAEKLLDHSSLFPGRSRAINSPVLGVPVSLFRLALLLKQQYHNLTGPDREISGQLKNEIGEWEMLVMCDRDPECPSTSEMPNRKSRFYRDGNYLYILVVSLLLQQLVPNVHNNKPPRPASSDCWQITKALEILQYHTNDDEWKLCFIGNWPIYTLGFFVGTREGIELVRREIETRWRLTKFSQLARFGNDLEHTWARRGFADDAQGAMLKYSI